MFSTLRTRFGIPGVISVIALVFAMFGGAYAASNNSSGGGKATASKTKTVKGPRGPKGATGPAGPQGPAGPAGAKGDAGANGSNGTNGSDGTSATTAAYSGPECANGGVEVKSASPTAYVCNGEDGETGFTETLPSGKSEHGTWSFGPLPAPTGATEEETLYLPISFPIPLAASMGSLATPAVHYMRFEEPANPTAECPGTWDEPVAAPGNLCIYQTLATSNLFFLPAVNMETEEFGSVGRSGVLLHFSNLKKEQHDGGTWVVTAP